MGIEIASNETIINWVHKHWTVDSLTSVVFVNEDDDNYFVNAPFFHDNNERLTS